MTRFGRHAVQFELTSDRFDHSSVLPADANAGNRFYGRDVAELLATKLGERGFESSFLDEDWGWQVHAKRADSIVLEISIHHNPEEDAAREDDWMLMVRALQPGVVLGVIPRVREVELDDGAIDTLVDAFRGEGIELRRAPG